MNYKKQVELLIDVLPFALKDDKVALKGGTSINLFHRDMPRLSVDIDLHYIPIEDRATTFKNIHMLLGEIKKNVVDKLGCKVLESKKLEGVNESKLFIEKNGITIKVEPNYVIRGCIIPPVVLELTSLAQAEFEREVDILCLEHNELYAGKLCAALDRQHPRDLFDVHLLIKNEGVTKKLKDVFLVYLLSHSRPIIELLVPNRKELKKAYENELKGMERIEVSLGELEQARETLITEINSLLDSDDKELLLSFLDLDPDWEKAKYPQMKHLPAINWKLKNLKKASDKKRMTLRKELEKHF